MWMNHERLLYIARHNTWLQMCQGKSLAVTKSQLSKEHWQEVHYTFPQSSEKQSVSPDHLLIFQFLFSYRDPNWKSKLKLPPKDNRIRTSVRCANVFFFNFKSQSQIGKLNALKFVILILDQVNSYQSMNWHMVTKFKTTKLTVRNWMLVTVTNSTVWCDSLKIDKKWKVPVRKFEHCANLSTCADSTL